LHDWQQDLALPRALEVMKMDRETIKVRVRPVPEDDNKRIISFPHPKGIADSEWLNMGIPIDADQVIFVVGRNVEGKYHYPDFKSRRWVTFEWDTDLPGVLAAAQKSLMEFLNKHNYEVKFG
jgi:hypothetical protein